MKSNMQEEKYNFTISQDEYDNLNKAWNENALLENTISQLKEENAKLKQTLLNLCINEYANYASDKEDKNVLEIQSYCYGLKNVSVLLEVVGYKEMQKFIKSKLEESEQN